MARLHRDYRFKMYVEAVVKKGGAVQGGYTRWLCREWNTNASPGSEIESLRLLMRWSDIVPGGDPLPPNERTVFELPCDAWVPEPRSRR